MSFYRSISKTVTLSSLGAWSGYSTQDGNGDIRAVLVSISKAVGAGSKVVVTGESTQKAVLTF